MASDSCLGLADIDGEPDHSGNTDPEREEEKPVRRTWKSGIDLWA